MLDDKRIKYSVPANYTENSEIYLLVKDASENGILFSKDMTVLQRYPEAKEDATYIVPQGVEIIDVIALDACKNLKRVELPSSVKEIWRSTFRNCVNLEEVILLKGVELEGDTVFDGCPKNNV